MSQYTDIIEARRLLNTETAHKNTITSISHTFGEDHWVHTLAGGKSFKVFQDKRKKDAATVPPPKLQSVKVSPTFQSMGLVA